jgi:hypothetical protein
MSRLEVPLAYRRLQTTGDLVAHPELILEIKTDSGKWESIMFWVDSCTEMTTMPAAVAKSRNLPIPRRPIRGLTFQGQEVRSGLLRARIPGMDATEYVFPCYLLDDPDGSPARSRNLLGLTGVIKQVRLTFDDIPSMAAPCGVLIVEKK